MATSILVSEVIEQARVRLDEDEFDSETYITSTMALDFVKYGAQRLSAILRRAFGADYFITRGTITTTASVDTVDLPANCTDLRQIAWLRSATESVPLEMMSVDEFLASGEEVKAWDAAPKYRLHGNQVRFAPIPNQAYTLSLYYDTGIFVTATTDTIDAQPGWEEWLVHDFMVKALERDEKDPSLHMAEKAAIEREIFEQAAQRDRFRTHEVRDLWDGGEWIDSRSLYVRR